MFKKKKDGKLKRSGGSRVLLFLDATLKILEDGRVCFPSKEADASLQLRLETAVMLTHANARQPMVFLWLPFGIKRPFRPRARAHRVDPARVTSGG